MGLPKALAIRGHRPCCDRGAGTYLRYLPILFFEIELAKFSLIQQSISSFSLIPCKLSNPSTETNDPIRLAMENPPQ